MTTATAIRIEPPAAPERQIIAIPIVGAAPLVSNRFAMMTDVERAAIREPAGIVTRSREATDTAQILDRDGAPGIPSAFLAQPFREAIKGLPLANRPDTDARADALAAIVPDGETDAGLRLVRVEPLTPVEIEDNGGQRRLALRWPLTVPVFRHWRATLTISASPALRIHDVIRALNVAGASTADPDGNPIRYRVDPAYRHAVIVEPLGASLDAAAQRRQPAPDDLPLTVGTFRSVARELIAELRAELNGERQP